MIGGGWPGLERSEGPEGIARTDGWPGLERSEAPEGVTRMAEDAGVGRYTSTTPSS